MNNHRPYRDIPSQHKPVEWTALIILAILVVIVAFFIARCTNIVIEKLAVNRTLSPIEKMEHDRLLRKHGLSGVSVVLVKDEGRFFIRDGRLNKFQ